MPRSLILARGRTVTLLQAFSVLSAVLVLLIGVTLGWRLQNVVEDIALKQEATLAQGQAETLLQAHLFTHGLSGPLTPAVLHDLGLYTQANMSLGLFVRVKVWSPTGTVLYSDVSSLIGRRFPIDDDLGDVLSGKVSSVADVSDLSAAENATERSQFTHLLEVYVPIRATIGRGGSHIVGAYELYQDLTLLDAQEADLSRTLWSSMAVGFLVLYISLFLIVRNASRRLVRHSAEMAHQALHDPLTDLPNRTLLLDRVQQALRTARREQTTVALLLMDLDRFKEVNDTFGHQHGDQLLVQVGQRLRAQLRATDTVARLGGDEFALLLPATDATGAVETATKILSALELPIALEGYSMAVVASMGIALAPQHGEEPTMLLRHADVAMYAAKRAMTGYAVYAAAEDQYSPSRLGLGGELRTAIATDQLRLYYQPKVDLTTGRLDSVEALVRWQHPTRGFMPPDQFIPLAEQTGLITPLSHWVLRTALHQCRLWQDAGRPIRVAVNLSTRLLLDEHLVETIMALLQAEGVAPCWLAVEITESAMLGDPARALSLLTCLHDTGVRVAIDDFGTGYSSMSYLKRLPVDEIKIDKSFVLDMPANSDDATIARSIIDLGHNLNLSVVAEGVEDDATWRQLRDMGCDHAQGYFLSRPLPAADFVAWLDVSPVGGHVCVGHPREGEAHEMAGEMTAGIHDDVIMDWGTGTERPDNHDAEQGTAIRV